jgi:hypothetical protein
MAGKQSTRWVSLTRRTEPKTFRNETEPSRSLLNSCVYLAGPEYSSVPGSKAQAQSYVVGQFLVCHALVGVQEKG